MRDDEELLRPKKLFFSMHLYLVQAIELALHQTKTGDQL